MVTMIYLEKYLLFKENIGNDYAEQYYLDGLQGLYTYDDIDERLEEFVDADFPYGLNNIPEPLILYRLLNVDSIEDINKNKLGVHFVGDKDMFDDEDFLYSASILSGNDEIKNWYLVSIETNEDNLDIDATLGNRAEYPYEYEFTIKNDNNLKIIDIQEINNDRYK